MCDQSPSDEDTSIPTPATRDWWEPLPTPDEITLAEARRRRRRLLHAGVFRGPDGWELHCERCQRTPVRVYQSKARAERALALHERCCAGVDTSIWG